MDTMNCDIDCSATDTLVPAKFLIVVNMWLNNVSEYCQMITETVCFCVGRKKNMFLCVTRFA